MVGMKTHAKPWTTDDWVTVRVGITLFTFLYKTLVKNKTTIQNTDVNLSISNIPQNNIEPSQ